MQMRIEPQEQLAIPVNTKQRRDRLRALVNELEDGIVLSLDLTEVITDGQEDG